MARIHVVVVDPFADWEPALLTSGGRTHLGDEIRWLSPGGRPVYSLGGMSVSVDGAVEDFDASQADALVVIGSPLWESADAPDLSLPLQQAARAGIVVAGICGATLALARAGLLDERSHTSNGPDYIMQHVSGYHGQAHYQNVPQAVRDGKVVTASGAASTTFAIEVLQLLHPEAAEQLSGFRVLFGLEHQIR